MIKHLFITSLFLISVFASNAQEFKYDPSLSQYKYDGATLNFQDLTGKFDPQLKQKFVETFYKVYPALIKDFDFKTKQVITIMIDSSLNVLANHDGNTIRLHPKYFQIRQADIDVLTHELMNILQDKNKYQAPYWLQIGISDYVRYKYGVNNEAANWSLSKPSSSEKYYYGYRTTARFLVWIESVVKKDFVKKLIQNLDTAPYNDAIWKQLTGNSVQELWERYINNPDI